MNSEAIPPSDGGPGGASDRPAEPTLSLLAFFLEMLRGMEEFRRAYGIKGATSELSASSPEELARRLFAGPGGERAREALMTGVQDLKLHHAALIEGYHEATHTGARRLLDDLDPEAIRREFAGARIRVGPIALGTNIRPVLVQVVWEEFLRRYRQLRALESADFERFYRDGFRNGYHRFRETRLGRASADVASATDAG